MQPPQPPYGGPPQPGPGMGGFGPPPGLPGPPGGPGWGPPPPRKPNNGAALVIILVAVLVVVGGGAGFLYWLYRASEGVKSAAVAPVPSDITLPTPTYLSPPPTYSPPVAVPTYTPPPTHTEPVFDPHPGDCVRNSGTYTRPILHMAKCTSGHYRILHRYENTNDRRLCNVGTYAVWYTDPVYLLCMRRI